MGLKYNPEEVQKYITYLWSQGMVDNIARKVAEEPQHVIDEEEVDEGILERHDRRQMEMFDDPDWNYSGLRK